jgi:hypothetical protein
MTIPPLDGSGATPNREQTRLLPFIRAALRRPLWTGRALPKELSPLTDRLEQRNYDYDLDLSDDPPSDDERQEDRQSDSDGANAVGVLLILSGAAFVLTYPFAGQRAAGIAFWTVMIGLPSLLAVVSALGAAWRGDRNNEIVEAAALAIIVSEQLHDSERRSSDNARKTDPGR